jgi:NAD(P)-dependent dehydrogenase (short-subunit alcohol dehydrogenase family)
MLELKGKTAFVTGAASGIGLGVATALARAGAKVMLCDLRRGALDHAVGSLRETGADVEGVTADVSVKAELQAAANATLARFGKVHVLVNNAGVSGGGLYGGWTDPAWDWVIGVNLRAVVWGVEIFGPLLERDGAGGHIVNVASMAGLVGQGSTPYTVTKAAVVALSEALRRELGRRGIGVSVVCPGLVATNIAETRGYLSARFEAAVAAEGMAAPTPEQMGQLKAMLAGGADPMAVGELVREGIEGDWPYIFTDLQFEPAVDARFEAIRAGFDKVRGQAPR